MTNIVLLLTNDKLQEVQSFYATNKVIRNAPGVVFAAKLADTAITVYKSGKVMFQGMVQSARLLAGVLPR